jgi:meso-butanediol dehydrogenase / (S,S)-butanediol dehydrogenase / diacetyl reductase
MKPDPEVIPEEPDGRDQRTVLVTGAAGAIGSATVRAFLDEGFAVAGIDRNPAVLKPLHARYVGSQVDLGDEGAVTTTIREIGDLGRLSHVVGVAGGAMPDETSADPLSLDVATFMSSVEANLVTQFVVVRAALPLLRKGHGDRSIALTSSFNALAGWGLPGYSAAKAGLIGMMYALTAPLGAEGIRINVVAPGTVRTPRTELIWQHDAAHFPTLTSQSALGRLAAPEDVARAFLALATLLTHVTGQVLVVDGGQMVKRA